MARKIQKTKFIARPALRFLAVLVGIVAPQVAAAADSPVAAEVNGVVITEQRLSDERPFLSSFGAAALNDQDKRAVDRQLLEHLIQRELLLQEAQREKLEPTAEELESTIAESRKQFATENEFLAHLTESHLDEKRFAAGVRADLAIQKLLKERAITGVSLAPAELETEYEKRRESLRVPAEVKGRQIFFRVDPKMTEAQILERRQSAERVLEETQRDPSQFAAVAKRYSDGPARTNGGELGWFTRNQMPKDFADAAFALEPGQLSGVVRTESGYHIILVEAKRGGEVPDLESVKDKLVKQILEERTAQAVRSYITSLRTRAKVIVYLE